LFALSLGHPPTRRLLDEAMPQMQALAHQASQCCHLSQRYGTSVVVIAQIESPRPMGYSVRLGERHPVVETAAGLTLLAFEPAEETARWLEVAAGRGLDETVRKIIHRTLAAIRKHGHLRKPNGQAMGIMDLSCPVLGADGIAVASLTIPYVAEQRPEFAALSEGDALQALAAAAGRITQALGGAAPG
jgi:DNA-binding IclR family transcriptional regulator